MNYDTTATEVQQVREESLLIQDLELNQLQTLSMEEMSSITVGGGEPEWEPLLPDPPFPDLV